MGERVSADLLEPSVLACAAYLCVVYGVYFSLLAVAYVENRRYRREDAADDLGAISDSRFSPGVSIVVAAHDEESALPDAVRSLLSLAYPEFEVIVVNDGSTDGTLARMDEEFGLVQVEVPSREVVETEQVTGLFRGEDGRLLVVDKVGGGKADALNAGLNLCRHRFVCGVDADMVFARDALSRAMRAFMSDPARVVGLTSYIEIAEDPAAALAEGTRYRIPEARPLLAFQALDYLRAFYNNRIAWSRLHFMLCAVGAFQVWRRDLLDELGGWSRGFTCEDIELTFRVHKVLRERGLPYRVLCLPDRVGITEGPNSIRKLVAQRERWQRVILETWWAYRRLCFDGRYGAVGILGLPFYFLSEVVAPVFEILAVLTLGVGAALGLVDWWLFAFVTLLISLANSALAMGALLIADLKVRVYRAAGIVRFVLLMPLELLLYRPVLAWARIKGTWRFLRGDKAWHKFERNVRADTA